MKTSEFVLRGGTLVDATTDGLPRDLLIRDGKIAAHLSPRLFTHLELLEFPWL